MKNLSLIKSFFVIHELKYLNFINFKVQNMTHFSSTKKDSHVKKGNSFILNGLAFSLSYKSFKHIATSSTMKMQN